MMKGERIICKNIFLIAEIQLSKGMYSPNEEAYSLNNRKDKV